MSFRMARNLVRPGLLALVAGMTCSIAVPQAALARQDATSDPSKKPQPAGKDDRAKARQNQPGLPVSGQPAAGKDSRGQPGVPPGPGGPGAPVQPGTGQPSRPAAPPQNPAMPPGTNPGAQPGAQPGVPQGVAPVTPINLSANPGEPSPSTPMPMGMDGDTFKFGPYSDPVEVKLLADLVASTLKIQIISTDVALRDKKVLLLTQLSIPKTKLLDFFALLLSQNGQTIVRDVADIYIIKPITEMGGFVGTDAFSTTRIIPTPGMKPSALQQAITVALSQAGAPGATPPRMAFLDDLGYILITDTPRQIAILTELIDRLADLEKNRQWTRFELKYIAAPAAKNRILEQLGRTQRLNSPQAGVDPAQAANMAAAGGGAGAPTLTNLPERLSVSIQGNALMFRGRPDELELLSHLISLIDVVNTLNGEWYPLGGRAAATIVDMAKRQGLGDVITLQSNRENAIGGLEVAAIASQRANFPGQFAGTSIPGELSGPTFVIDAEGRGFMYYATAEQHKRVKQIVEQMGPLIESDEVVYRFYKLRHSKADETAEVIRGLISNSVPTSSSPLLPGGASRNTAGANGARRTNTPRPPIGASPEMNRPEGGALAGGESSAIDAGDDTFVLADKAHNQIVVKAPRRTQPQFANLIDKLDLRRPQVFIDAQIIVVTDSDEFRLAVETELVNAGGKGGALRTIFPPSPTGISTSGNILNKPTVNPVIGLTAAIISSDQVPIIVTALSNTTDARVVASPKLLVDDNEVASVSSLEQRPTQTQSQSSSSGTTLTGFGGFEPAGPSLEITPQISSGDYLRIKYDIELSSFVGDPPSPGLPPPKIENKVKSDSVTVPSDSTIVIGGMVFDQTSNTVIKVPLLGDIPVVGQLFRDERQSTTRRRLYVFLTPRIMRDPNFNDLKAMTKGPMAVVKIDDTLPPPEPATIEILPLRSLAPTMPASLPAPAPSPVDPAPASTPATPATTFVPGAPLDRSKEPVGSSDHSNAAPPSPDNPN